MRTEPAPDHLTTPRRASALAVTATTLVTLAAMSASVSASPAPSAVASVEARLDSTVARAVAAVVAAAARDFLGTKQTTAAAALLEPLADVDAGGAAPRAGGPVVAAGPSRLLGERLLDLPPPIC
jgi:hypothetical protein